MIRVTLTADDMIRGEAFCLLKVRRAGIPVRIGLGGELRLLPVWNAEGTKVIGKGTLKWVRYNHEQTMEFTYEPPRIDDPNVIDVEARVVPDQLLLQTP